MSMNPRQEILQLLFDSCVFEGNFSELALRLGYKKDSRSTIDRVKSNKSNLTEKKLDALYAKIKEEYLIGDDEITTIANSVAYAKNLYSAMRDIYGTGNDWHNLIFGIFVAECYSVQPSLDEELIKELKELKLHEPEIYYGMLAHFFILCKGVNPYTKKGRKPLATQLSGLNELLYSLYPGDNRSYESGKIAIRLFLADENPSILKLIYNLRHTIRGYVDNSYYENFLREQGILLDVGEESFWTAPGETFHEGCELWYLSVIPTKSQRRGAYTAMKLRAKSSATTSFELIEAYNIMFSIDESYDDIHIFQAYELTTGKVEYALFSYDEESRLLELDFEDSPEQTFNLPQQLKCLNHSAPKGRDEKVWSKIVEKLLNEKCYKFLLIAANSLSNSNLEYLCEYDVTNVCIDRTSLTVTVEKDSATADDKEIITETKSYTIAIDAHTFLENLTPAEFASVVRYKDTGELGIAWNELGQNIPLREFTEKQPETQR